MTATDKSSCISQVVSTAQILEDADVNSFRGTEWKTLNATEKNTHQSTYKITTE